MTDAERERLSRYSKMNVPAMTFGELDDYALLLRLYLAELEAWKEEKKG